MKLGDPFGSPSGVVIHRGLLGVRGTVVAAQGGDRLQCARASASKLFDGPSGLGDRGGHFETVVGGFALGLLELGEPGGRVFGGHQVFHAEQQGFDCFASSGHDTKIRRQRARIIQVAIKVTSR
jgi:hypothetical protein